MKRFFSLPINVQLAMLLLLLTLPAVGIIIHSGLKQRQDALTAAKNNIQELANNIGLDQDKFLSSTQQLLETVARLDQVQERDQAKVNQLFSEISQRIPQIKHLALSDTDGKIWATATPLKGNDSIAGQRQFVNAMATGQLSSGEYQPSESGDFTLDFGLPLKDKKGTITGVFNFGVDLASFKKILQFSGLPSATSYIILDHRGTIVYSGRNPKLVGKIDRKEFFTEMQGDDRVGSFRGMAHDGTERLIVFRKQLLESEKTPYMYIRTGIPYEDAVAAANSALVRNILLLAPSLIVTFIIVLYLGRRFIVDRVTTLKNTVDSIAQGNLDVRVADHVAGGELGELGQAFDTMARKLAEREREKQAARDALIAKQLQLKELNATLEMRVAEEVEKNKRRERIMYQQARQASMGEMINFIAHQWCQPLTNVGLRIQCLQQAYHDKKLTPEQFDGEVDACLDKLDYLSDTINDFRNFFRPERAPFPFDLENALEKCISLVQSYFAQKAIELRFADHSPGILITGYPNEFSHALLNILYNAKDVLLERAVVQPRVEICCRQEGTVAVITVRDNGGGIICSDTDKVFELYFTSKEHEKGTGIGLYMSRMIIEKNMGGHIRARNTADGAEFVIELPRAIGQTSHFDAAGESKGQALAAEKMRHH
ncbi:MAG TPA: sensor histidine kinase, partial [Desulfatiglandales bacterium]|nr:sensor histidine kinase [Desulfatiglandales bacterium]